MSQRHPGCFISAYQNIKILLDTSKDDKVTKNEGYKQLQELENRALEYQRESRNMDSLNVSEVYLSEARERFQILSQLIVHGHNVFDHALDEFQFLILLYAAQSKRHGELLKSKVNKREGIEVVLNTVKERNDTTLRRYRYAESDYKDLLSIEKRWLKFKARDERAREMDLMNPRDVTMDERRYKHLRNFIKEEVPENSENADAQKELEDLLLTDRKYFALHPDEETVVMTTPELVRKPSKRTKTLDEASRQPHRGTLHRSTSQASLSSEEGDKRLDENEKKIAVSMERLKESAQREQQLQAKIEELTTRLSSFASRQLIEGNPNIADLSDPNRPTKLSEKFNNVYDNEWSDAFEELQDNDKSEDEIVKLLMHIIINAEKFSKDIKEQQLQHLMDSMRFSMVHVKWTNNDQDIRVDEKSTTHKSSVFSSATRHAKEFQKSSARASVPSLCVMFKEMCIKEGCNLNYKKFVHVEQYIDKVVEYLWLMTVQDPPMCICWQKQGEQMDKKSYKYYEKKGDIVHLTVWPAVTLYDKGPLVSKGFIWPQ
ncbi:uncharacterized protein LOC125679511 isoform X2 [Ostrea edulis]|nr:uncharacterized protein LOC125679511 isoform X2 [Ostrea edulis]XP_048774734.2 uncharacterized protein LOC125679511 isoform X2 [Ostrea edulis]XP_048774735.2 uncharacterized protein LOC125679511 isoform X2 [Ostrea edulis]